MVAVEQKSSYNTFDDANEGCADSQRVAAAAALRGRRRPTNLQPGQAATKDEIAA